MTTPDGYIDADAAAQLLNVSRATLNRLAHQHAWRRTRSGRAYVYVTEDVRATERTRRAR